MWQASERGGGGVIYSAGLSYMHMAGSRQSQVILRNTHFIANSKQSKIQLHLVKYGAS